MQLGQKIRRCHDILTNNEFHLVFSSVMTCFLAQWPPDHFQRSCCVNPEHQALREFTSTGQSTWSERRFKTLWSSSCCHFVLSGRNLSPKLENISQIVARLDWKASSRDWGAVCFKWHLMTLHVCVWWMQQFQSRNMNKTSSAGQSQTAEQRLWNWRCDSKAEITFYSLELNFAQQLPNLKLKRPNVELQSADWCYQLENEPKSPKKYLARV